MVSRPCLLRSVKHLNGGDKMTLAVLMLLGFAA